MGWGEGQNALLGDCPPPVHYRSRRALTGTTTRTRSQPIPGPQTPANVDGDLERQEGLGGRQGEATHCRREDGEVLNSKFRLLLVVLVVVLVVAADVAAV